MKFFNLNKLTVLISSIVALILFSYSASFAQTDLKIGSNPGTKTASAVLEAESTTKGFLMPRMTDVQMAAISSPATGLQIYNTTYSCVYTYTGVPGWVSNCATASNGVNKSGINIQLGGALTTPTTVTTSAANTLSIPGLQTAPTTDSLVTVNNATGLLSKTPFSNVVSAGLVANNGLTKTGNVITLGGTLLVPTTITQATNNLNFTGGNVGIGTTTPNATLQVTGSMSLSVQTILDDYVVTANDYIILAQTASGSSTIPGNIYLSLPTASAANKGRVLVIGKIDESTTNILNISPPIYFSTATSISSLNFAHKYKIVCDGTKWWIIEGQ